MPYIEGLFGAIHLSGKCNRSCYFCIGQHMMVMDGYDVLDTWPLPGLDDFITQCKDRHIPVIHISGTNTDPMLYKHLPELTRRLRMRLPGVQLGVRTNGVVLKYELLRLFDRGSVHCTTFSKELYLKTMGAGHPPNLKKIVRLSSWPVRLEIVLCPEVRLGQLFKDIDHAIGCGVQDINLREPYGQPHIGDPLDGVAFRRATGFGMPQYTIHGTPVTYWDTRKVLGLSSVNL